MFSFGVLAGHHICVPLPITRQRWLFCLLVCRGTPFLLWCGCLLSSYPLWHAPSGPTQLCSFGWCVIPVGHFPQKCPNRNLKISLSLSSPPNHALLPLTHDLTVLCIGWVQAGEVWALRVPSFHLFPNICLLFSHLPWSGGLSAQLAVLSSTLYVSYFFDFPFLLGADIYLSLGFILPSAHFLIVLISCHIILSFLS